MKLRTRLSLCAVLLVMAAVAACCALVLRFAWADASAAALEEARADMERALPLLKGKPGPSPALFYLETERITLRAPERYWCDADEALLQALRDCLGAENVKLRNGETAR